MIRKRRTNRYTEVYANEIQIISNNGYGRTTGIEPAHGGFTIHCLDPLGYIRPYTNTPLYNR